MRERIDLIYSAVHEKCGKEIKQKDPSVLTQIDLDALIRKTLWEGKLKTIELRCSYCNEKLKATHAEVFVNGEAPIGKREIEKFIPFEFKMILN